MKWGGRKKPSSASSSFISHASPFSWLSKFKQMRINSEPCARKMNHKAKQSASLQYSCAFGDEVYPNDNDAFCRQPFNEESYEDKKSKDIDENAIPSSSCHGGRREGKLKLKERGVGQGEERKLLNDGKVAKEMNEYDREKEYEDLRRRLERKAQKAFHEKLLTLERAKEIEFGHNKAVEKDVFKFESPRTICTPRTHAFATSAVSKNSILGHIIAEIEKTDRFERQNLKQTEELKAKTNRQRQPHHLSRELQRRKPKPSTRIKKNSPRVVSKVEICKIKALEDKWKGKLKMKKQREETPGLDSFAVIKCSLDPKQDFRDSMVEMIMKNQISELEEMEELLACYLTLNEDEYHDLIIKVFRRVWFDMSQGGLGIKLDMQCCCYE